MKQIEKLKKSLSVYLTYTDITGKKAKTDILHPTKKELTDDEIFLIIKAVKAKYHNSHLTSFPFISKRFYLDFYQFNQPVGSCITISKNKG